jgi:hypothetical protein
MLFNPKFVGIAQGLTLSKSDPIEILPYRNLTLSKSKTMGALT